MFCLTICDAPVYWHTSTVVGHKYGSRQNRDVSEVNELNEKIILRRLKRRQKRYQKWWYRCHCT